jgi:NAD(P)-dependent dehydrogenase (short-subunit alcohol dehydrogenase family)
MDFSGQAVIITGAAGNLGAAIAQELATRGAKLALVDVSAEALAKTAPTIGEVLQLGGVDLRTEAGAQAVAEKTLARFGRIDGLANTVGTFRMSRIDADAAAQFSMLMELNALSALLISKAVAPQMSKNKYGRILHVAAGAALRGGAEMSAYSASKSALMRVVESLSEEFKQQGVTANCVLPGTVDTPQNRADMPDADRNGWVQPADIAKVAAFLLSRESRAVTGGAIPVVGVGW